MAGTALKYGLLIVGGTLAIPPLLSRLRKAKLILKNNLGMEVHVCKLGAALSKIVAPDRDGKKADIVLYPADPKNNANYMGVVVGRVANRISHACFTMPDDKKVHLTANDGPHALHGGVHGFQTKIFEAEATSGPGYKAIVLKYTSPAGEEGYPGELRVTVAYRLATDKNELACEITAQPVDEATPVNIVQHTYWNMAGHNSGRDILDHWVHMPTSDHYTPVGADLIPTGEILPVQGTPYDFTQPRTIGERIAQCGPAGYDLNYINQRMGPQARFICKGGMVSDRPKLVATVQHKETGRCLDIYTTAPGMQFYAGSQLEHVEAKDKAAYKKYAGFCLETQAFPNSVNEQCFPGILIKPGDTYRHQTVYNFYCL